MKTILVSILIVLSVSLSAQQSNTSPSKIYQMVEQMPEYPGGEEKMMQFVRTNTHYPDFEKQHKIEGMVVIGFVVTETGDITNATVKKSVSPGLDQEALRVVNSLGKFKPGKTHGKVIAVQYIIPITFTLPQADTKRN